MTFPVFSAGQTAYNLTNSLRFRSSASAYLNRTPASAGNRRTWTWSGWVKRGALNTGTFLDLFATGTVDGEGTRNYIAFNGTDQIVIGYATANWRVTTQVFRDPSAWYNIVIAFDSTQATAANRLLLYVNGSQVTSFATNNAVTLNVSSAINNTGIHYLGRDSASAQYYFDGYLAEVNFIDGQALTPSSFGQNDTMTGVWQPKKYTGTYGTNGFYLPFTDNSALTSGSNAGLGKDFSGNGNYWNTNNISITSGATYDSMTDVPTLTSATASNYCVLNPLDNGGNTLSDGNLTIVSPTSTAPSTRGTFGVSSGKYYWEVTIVSANGSVFGIANSAHTITSDVGATANSWGYLQDGRKANNGSYVSYGASYTNGDVIGVALDMDAGTLTFYKNNTSQGVAYSSLTGTMFPCVSDYSANSCTWNFNFGQRPFAYTPPTGYVALNTYNLPTPTIGATASSQANKYFDIGLVTGSSSVDQVITTNFAPDFVWSKCRNTAILHGLYDIIRGGANYLSSDSTSAEVNSAANAVTFNSNGVTLKAGGSIINDTGRTYVDWLWKANGTGVTNTAGSITSTVSANTTSGFSIVKYTGNGISGATIGHGLGVAPKMIIVKLYNGTLNNWRVYHSSLTSAAYSLLLNSTSAQLSDSTIWNSTAPTSSVFSVGNGADTNYSSSYNYIAYCFAEIAGFSKFGSYTGNGSSDGPFIYTGFRPRYIMYKRSSDVGNWQIMDTARWTYNPEDGCLFPNLSNAETFASSLAIDLLSNGFKLRNTDSDRNANGSTYIYACFAENPFKYSLAR